MIYEEIKAEVFRLARAHEGSAKSLLKKIKEHLGDEYEPETVIQILVELAKD